MTPQQAISAGANFVVMGRPILEATDPVGLIAQIKEDIHHE
jgi:orotidine-5'-phosphate decarboxylase